MKTKLVILILLFIETGSMVTAQQTYFNQIFDINRRSFLGTINDIVQDPQGYIWLAIQNNGGIVRYDGSRMAPPYRNEPNNPNSPSGQGPECLVTDSTGIIWIGYWGTGLDRFDPESGKFKNFRHAESNPTSLSSDTVRTVLIDHSGNLWIGTHRGLDLFNSKTGQFTHYSHSDSDPSSLSCSNISIIYEDRERTIWIGTGRVDENKIDGGLNRFDRNTGKFTRYMHNPNDPQSLKNDKVSAIFEDSRGRFRAVATPGSHHLRERRYWMYGR